MGPAPSYRLLHSLFLPPLPPPPSFVSELEGLANVVPFGELLGWWRIVKETGRSGFVCARNSRSDHGVVGSSWTKGGGETASTKSIDAEQARTARRSTPSKAAGGVGNKKAEDNRDTSSRVVKEEKTGGDPSKARDKRNLGKSWSKFDATKKVEHSGRVHSSGRSYSSSSQAKPSGGGDVRTVSIASAVQKASSTGRLASGEAKGGKQFQNKNKQYAPEQDLRRALDMCSKHADVKQALELYDKFNLEDKSIFNQYNYNIVLYLCSSAASNSLKPQKSGNERRGSEQENQPRGPLDELGSKVNSKNGTQLATATESEESADKERIYFMNRGFEVYETMKSLGVPPNEATFTAVARLAVAKEDGDLAFDMVKQMAEAKLSPRLRSYAPALYTYCKLKNAKKAFEVDEHMKEAGVALEESELEALLKLSVDAGLEDKVYSLLHRFRTTVRDVSPTVVEVIQQWFTGSTAASAGKSNWETLPNPDTVRTATESCGGGWHGLGWLGKGSWEVKSSVVDGRGVCQECGEQLVTIDLDPQETEMFAQSLSRMACLREAKNNEFKKFQAWLDRHGPFDAIVDGANVGLYNSNSGNGGFNFHQLNNVVTGIQKQLGFHKEPLILLHHRRTKGGPAASSFATRTLSKWIDASSIYTTPTGSNDDWYWLFAAVRYRCVLVTNDEMRDHLFSLLGNDFFPKWKERHQVRFTVNKEGLMFHMPPPYSTVIQESEKGSWHVPKSSNDDDVLKPREWMCITRVGHAAPVDTKSEEELTLSPISLLESCGSEVQARTATNLELKDISIVVEEVQSPKPHKSRKSTPKSSASSSPKSSTLQPSEVGQIEEQTTPPKRVSSATKKSRSSKSSTLQPSEVGQIEEQTTPPKRVSSATKKSRSSKSSTLQTSEVGKFEEGLRPSKSVQSKTKKPRSLKSSVLLQKLEAAEEFRSGDPIDFQI